ncbi:glycosyltransferase [Sulfurimonas sp. SWIR-19]|uniref:glycosyltransferase n=1 Tax=Sulfurimonas sp. SWIR-19 TaxID=2878390 RepID=UPI001CF5FA34|nr:glycosyltransferase [Sulfurimonas sp. SWIR-19]UCN00607.1 glycosyltransferase [Sulfurimonas sp. SWIR-19]
MYCSKKVFVLRALSWDRDARIQRWTSIYKGCTFIYGIWGKGNKEKNIYSITSFVRKPKKKLLIAIGYMIFSINCFFFIILHAKKNDIVIFTDFETLLFGVFAAKVKGCIIHYDIADPFFMSKPIPFKKFWKWIEQFYAKNIELVTIPHEKRKEIFQIPSKNTVIVENVPNFETNALLGEQKNNNMVVLGYFGNLEADARGIEILLKAVIQNKHLILHLAGKGTLEEKIINIVQKESRIKYFGEFSYNTLGQRMRYIDLYIAFYDSGKLLHTYAAPNKYYEHLYFGIPLVTTKIIPQSAAISQYKTGYCVENKEELFDFLLSITTKNLEEFSNYGKNARKLWDKNYANYYSKVKKEIYDRVVSV